jgi:hypothetical protein
VFDELRQHRAQESMVGNIRMRHATGTLQWWELQKIELPIALRAQSLHDARHLLVA